MTFQLLLTHQSYFLEQWHLSVADMRVCCDQNHLQQDQAGLQVAAEAIKNVFCEVTARGREANEAIIDPHWRSAIYIDIRQLIATYIVGYEFESSYAMNIQCQLRLFVVFAFVCPISSCLSPTPPCSDKHYFPGGQQLETCQDDCNYHIGWPHDSDDDDNDEDEDMNHNHPKS